MPLHFIWTYLTPKHVLWWNISHQCACFSADPKQEHADAIRWLARYLRGMHDKGTIFRPDPNRDLEVFVDADFAGNWDPKEYLDRDTARGNQGMFY